MTVKFWFSSACLCILFGYRVDGTYIRFFRDFNYTDTYHGSIILDGCNHLPDLNTSIFSVETDTCVILYQGQLGLDCKATEYQSPNSRYQRIRLKRSTTIFRYITGYRICNDDGRDLQLNINIVRPSHHTFINQKQYKIVKTYRNVCTCVNIQDDLNRVYTWAIQNHENQYMAFFESYCTERKHKAMLVLGGQTWFWEYPFMNVDNVVRTPLIIKSIGPSNNSTYFKHGCNIKDNIVDLQNKNRELKQKLLKSAITFNNSQTSMIAIQHKQYEEILKREQNFEESAMPFNESMINMLAIQQYQKVKIRKLEEKYIETESKLEKLQKELENSVGHFRDD